MTRYEAEIPLVPARAGFYTCDNLTGQQHSLRTRDKADALRLLHAWNEAHQQPSINLQMANACLMVGDPEAARRTWQHVMDAMANLNLDTPGNAGCAPWRKNRLASSVNS